MHNQDSVSEPLTTLEQTKIEVQIARQTWDAWIVVAVMSVVWGLLRLGSYPFPFPDESLRYLVEQTGTWPRLSPLAPLWNGFGHWIASLNAEAMPHRMQFAGQITLAVSAGLFYRIIVRFISLFLDLDEAPRWSPITIRIVGIASALFLVACPPVWRAAQSPHPSIFGLFIAIAATAVLLRYAERRTLSSFFLWAALAGAGSVESPLVFLFLPAWIVLVLWLPWGAPEAIEDPPEDLPTSRPPWLWLTGAVVITVTAMLCIAYAVQTYNGSEGYILHEFSRRLHILQLFSWNYIIELRGAMPTLRWLTITAGLLFPWILTVTLAGIVQNNEFSPGKRIIYAIISVAIVAQVMRIESLQAWSLLPSATYRVGVCLISAITFGLAAVAWLLEAERAFRRIKKNRPHETTPALLDSQFIAIVSGVVFLAIGGSMLGIAGVAVSHHQEEAQRIALHVFKEYTSAVIEDAADCEWVVTDGVFDHALRLEAWRTGSHLQPICILATESSWVLRATTRRLPDPESRILFSISPEVMLRDWLTVRPEQTQNVATQVGYDLWIERSVKLSPRRTLLLPAASDTATTDTVALLEHLRPFWSARDARLEATQHVKAPTVAFHLHTIRDNLARVANEAGVMAQDNGQNELALEAYAAARHLNPENISATVNAWFLTHNLDFKLTADFAEIPAGIKRRSRLPGHSSVLNLVRLHGTIHTPQALTVLTAKQRLTGDQDEALARIDAALHLLPKTASHTQVLHATAASLQWLTGDEKGAREAYLAILLEKPTDMNAMFELTALAVSEDRLEATVPLIDKARKAGATPILCDQLHATLCLEANAPAAAHTILQPYVTQNTRNATMWYLWGWTALGLQDTQAYKQAETELNKNLTARGWSKSLAAKAAIRANDLPGALLHAQDALYEQPNNQSMLESILRLCLALNDYQAAEPYAKNMLSIDSGHALARYLLGTKLLLDGDAATAEPLLARSAATVPRAETLNNLASAQLQLNKLNDASRTAKIAVGYAPERTEIWDTVAAVALAQKNPKEAETAARQALLLNPDAPEAWLRVAEAVVAGGNLAAARSWLERSLLNTEKELSPEIRCRLARLQNVL